MEDWSKVLGELAAGAADQRTRVRWRKTEERYQSHIDGEAQALADAAGFGYNNRRAHRAIASLMRMVGTMPELFVFTKRDNDISWYPTAGLGKALYTRVGHLSNPEVQAQNFVRTWASSDTEIFTETHLPKLLRYVQSRKDGTKISAEELLEILYRWEFQRKDVLAAISREYFSAKPKKEVIEK